MLFGRHPKLISAADCCATRTCMALFCIVIACPFQQGVCQETTVTEPFATASVAAQNAPVSEDQASEDEASEDEASEDEASEDQASEDQASSAAAFREAAVVASAKNLSLAFRNAAEKALPSVVKILCKVKRPEGESSILDIIGGEDAQVYDSVGSGVIVSADGLILTNYHVIEDAERISVKLNDGREFEAKDTKFDQPSDLAILRIKADDELPVAEIGSSDDLFVGAWVLAIGSPFMLDASVSAGIISGTGRRRQLSNVVTGQFLQTDAAINPGNSGGPLIDLDGKVVGINTAISSRTGGFQGIGFAIPIDRANWIKKELFEYGQVRRAYFGVRLESVDYVLAKQLKLPNNSGAYVQSVAYGYPGQRAGLKTGDVIIQFSGQQIDSPSDVAEIVQQSRIGEPLTVVVLRDGEKMELTVELIARP